MRLKKNELHQTGMRITKILTITVLLLLLTIFFTGGGHGTYLPAKLIYPFTMLLAKTEIGTGGLILGILQIPIYALIIEKKNKMEILSYWNSSIGNYILFKY